MRRLTAWIYGLLAAALLLYAAHRYARVRGQLSLADERLARLEASAGRLASENEALARRIAQTADLDHGESAGQDGPADID